MSFPIDLIPKVKDYFQTGSSVIVSPPVLDTDEDWVVLFRDYVQQRDTIAYLVQQGWVRDGKEYRSAEIDRSFASFRKGNLNLITMVSAQFYEKYKLSTKIATVLNLTDKAQRILVFELIREFDLPNARW